ncbi:MAG: FG-GAP-like repeat-containing protein [Immundisolibacteraceae bacterium]|nr:FG-GAP-like repeat-containing protein [Immundisolibacteraceae bacterium]
MINTINQTQDRFTTSSQDGLRAWARNLAIFTLLILASFQVAAEWLEKAEHNGVVFLLRESPASIDRYDLNTEQVLPSIFLANTPTDIAVDDSGIYVAGGQSVMRYDLDGQNQTLFFSSPDAVTQIALVESYLIVASEIPVNNTNARWTSLSTATGLQVDESIFYNLTGIAGGPQAVFGRSVGLSTTRVFGLAIGAGGTFETQIYSSVVGGVYAPIQSTVSPDGERVYDHNGMVYSASDLDYINATGGAFDAISFDGNIPVLLRGPLLFRLDNELLEIGQLNYVLPVSQISVASGKVYGFYKDGSGNLEATITPLAQVNQVPTLGLAVDATQLNYSPDQLVMSADGAILYLLHIESQNIFRWSAELNKYLAPIRLRGEPLRITYNEGSNTLYVSYDSGVVTQVDLNSGINEQSFFNVPFVDFNLIPVSSGLIVNHYNGTSQTFLYDGSGGFVDFLLSPYVRFAKNPIWSAANNRIYFIKYVSSPALSWVDVDASGFPVGPPRSGPSLGALPVTPPLLVSPSGNVVVNGGGGSIHEPLTLAQTGSLPGSIASAAWDESEDFFTIEAVGEFSTKFSNWSADFSVREISFDLVGGPIALFRSGSNFLFVGKTPAGLVFQTVDPVNQPAFNDHDRDGLTGQKDNCPLNFNPYQEDSDQDGTGDVCDNSLANSADYFPLIDGATWSYVIGGQQVILKVISGGPSVNGRATRRIRDVASGDTIYYSVTAGGLFLHREDVPDPSSGTIDRVIYNPPLKLLNGSPQVGDQLSSQGTAFFTFPGVGSGSLNYSFVSELLDGTQVTIGGAGNENEVFAYPVRQTLNVSGTLLGQQFNETAVFTQFLAAGLGVVRMVDDDGTAELVSSSLLVDTDGDGIVDSSDNCPLISNAGQEDFEGDFIGDPCDPDDDNDGMSDDYENQFGLNPQDDTDAGLDPDGDGFTNLAESEAGSDPFDQNSAPKRILVGLGSAGGGYAEQVSGFAPFANQQWPKIDWTKYNQAVGETRPALCDLDGDGNKELVLGMGSYPTSGGWLEIFDDATTGYAHLEWVRVPWGVYNQANGETYPACGDLDGDGRDELVIGLGPSGKGYLYLLDDALTGYAPLPGTPNGVGWLRVSWSDYSKGPGATHPAVGDMDGDGLAEIAIGLGEGGEGWVQLRDDLPAGMGGLAGTPAANGWARVDWSQYNQSSGISWPAICDLDGDNLGELVLGLDQGSSGWLQVLDSPGFTGASGTPAAGGWLHSGFPGYYAEQGVTFPACGDLDGDGRDELVIGLDSYPQDGGRIEVVEDLIDNLQHKSWIRVNWNGYNQNDGSTRPAVE